MRDLKKHRKPLYGVMMGMTGHHFFWSCPLAEGFLGSMSLGSFLASGTIMDIGTSMIWYDIYRISQQWLYLWNIYQHISAQSSQGYCPNSRVGALSMLSASSPPFAKARCFFASSNSICKSPLFIMVALAKGPQNQAKMCCKDLCN